MENKLYTLLKILAFISKMFQNFRPFLCHFSCLKASSVLNYYPKSAILYRTSYCALMQT